MGVQGCGGQLYIVTSRPVWRRGDPMLFRGLEQRLGTEGRCNMSLDRV